MAATVVISFKDIESNERVRREVQARCDALAEEFPETTRFEIILSADGNDHTALGHVTGNHTEATGQAQAPELFQAADKALDAVERQLRRLHDKKIFAQRREAQRASERRKAGS